VSIKKIFIVNPISLFPKVMASQERTYNMIKRLSKDHIVNVATYIKSNYQLLESQSELKNVCNKFHSIPVINPTNSFLRRAFHRARYQIYCNFFAIHLNIFTGEIINR